MTDALRPKLVQVIVRLTPAMHQALKEEAERDDRSMAQVVRLAIREHLRNRGETAPARLSVQAQHDRILELCAEVHPDETAFDVCAAIVPDSADRVMTFSEARTVIDTLEARKKEQHGNT